MKIDKAEQKLLGLTASEAAILSVLKNNTGGFLVTKLAQAVQIPRTTAEFLLKKLKTRGLAEQIKIGGHKEWRLKPAQEVAPKLRQIYFKFSGANTNQGEMVEISADTEITVYAGRKNIKEAYRRMLTAGKNNRVFAIQGNLSAKMSLEKIEWDYFTDLHHDFRRAGIVMEGLMNNETFKLFETLSAAQIRSHLGRLVVLYVIPLEYLDLDLDILFFTNQIYIIDVVAEKIIFIKNERLVKTFKSLFYLAESFGRKINLDEYLKNLIKEKEKI